MNLTMKEIRKILIGLVIAIIVVLLTYSLFLIYQDSKRNESNSVEAEDSITLLDDNEVDSAIKKKGYSEDEISSMTKDQKDKIILAKDFYYEDNKIRLYSNAKQAQEYEGPVNDKYQKYVKNMIDENFDAVIADVDKILKVNNLTKGDNLKLAAIYSDAIKMSRYHDLNKAGKEAVLTGHHDPLALVADTLFAYVRRREAVILDGASKTPVFEGKFSIDGYTILKTDDENYANYKDKWVGEQIRNIYKVDLSIPEVDGMYCIVLEANDGTLRIAGYYGDTANNFLTVSERKEMGVDQE